MKSGSILSRYVIATAGLVLIALGVAMSLKSNLGTAPISCPPAIFNLRWGRISVGVFTWITHFVYIAFQAAVLRRNFKLSYLMQIPAAFFFGYLCDGCIWLLKDVQLTSYLARMLFCLMTIVVTAAGLRLELMGKVWMLAGDKTIEVMASVLSKKVSVVKVAFDFLMVLTAAVFGIVCFGNLLGDGNVVIIREGTLTLALLTGPCMRITDPLLKRLFRNYV